jgi:hypothetical protein
MRILGLVVALLVTFSMLAAAQTYVRHWRSAPDHSPSNSYGYPGKTNTDTSRTATGNSDPSLQHYYSHSEGWTYYNLPPDSSARRSGDQ